ncbi:group 1 glycosyl transferase [Flammeovirgaceae bacterium 311]|nr:group 1 glycosyl transferase [Flammeovirgaceae bacterium 311]
MKILFLGYWSANEGLSVSTIYPHLQVLAAFPFVDRIFYCSIERESTLPAFSIQLPKVSHIPLHSPPQQNVILNKVNDFILFPKKLNTIIAQEHIDLLICRGAPAGILGHLVHLYTKIPYWVESFEPHAAYMLESGVWPKWDLRYLIEHFGESAQLRTATAIMPVAEGYRSVLISKAVPEEKLMTLPCTVDVDYFGFRETTRRQVRAALGLADQAVCGIYVGKFGGLYYDEEAFEIFRLSRQLIPNFHLIILSPQPAEEIRKKLMDVGFQENEFFVDGKPHHEIPLYLHAADFAYALYRPSPSKKYLSPIKIGEYWAAGLPVMLSEGVGDETEIIAAGKGGVLFTMKSVQTALKEMRKVVEAVSKSDYKELAIKYRGRRHIAQVYEKAFALTAAKPSSDIYLQTK